MGPFHMKGLLSTTDLAVGFGKKRSIEHIDLQLNAGELVALIGVNGSGKSTLLNTLSGLIPPLAGTVHLQDDPIDALRADQRARQMALVLTGRPQVGLLDVRTLVGLGRQPWTGHFGRLTNEDRERIEEAMRATDTLRFADRHIGQLSDGEAQRVMIARALAQDTPIILLDEPMAFLDLVNRILVFRLLRDLAHARGKAILLSTHDLQTALDLCDRFFVVHDSTLWTGTAAEARSGSILKEAFRIDGVEFDPNAGAFRSR